MSVRVLTKNIDVIKAASEESSQNKVILAHGENNIGLHDLGFTEALARKYPENGKKFEKDCKLKLVDLGDISWFEKGNLVIANCIAQNGIRSKYNLNPFDYDAFKLSMKKLEEYALKYNVNKIYMPKIGSGLAGGSWNKIYDIIEDVFLTSEGSFEVIIGYL